MEGGRSFTSMDLQEVQSWRSIVKIFDDRYRSATQGKADYVSKPIATKILSDLYWGGVAYIHLGGYMRKYQEFDHFVKKFFQMKNKISPPKKRKPPYKKVEEDGQGVLF